MVFLVQSKDPNKRRLVEAQMRSRGAPRFRVVGFQGFGCKDWGAEAGTCAGGLWFIIRELAGGAS